jgi:1,4-alpha-glucan branching enzyme
VDVQKLIGDFLYTGSFFSFEYFGVHLTTKDIDGKKKKGYVFRLYAPNASDVSVIGTFNKWTHQSNKMDRVHEWGIYETFITHAKPGHAYKFAFRNCWGMMVEKADPYAHYSEKRPATASIIPFPSDFLWQDQNYIMNRTRNFDQPMSIYEVHVGSWKKSTDQEFLSYKALADQLVAYVKDMGFTHIELMPLTQYPFDGSWGYQATGFLSLDSRYGTIDDFKYFVDLCHQNNIGVILDYVIVHFASDYFGLIEFDGTKLYEYFDPQKTYSQWGSPQFDLSKPVVRSLLFSGIHWFIETFHLDGIRIDAVSNIVYWDGNSDKGMNLGGIQFIKDLNQFVHTQFPAVMMIAEDSTAFPGTTKDVLYGGLGFDYKWDMGWMNDSLKYYGLDQIYKFYDHHKLTFSMHYFYSENFMLPLSHDEVVHGKGTILNKMWGNYDDKFALLRNLYCYQFLHPGKKLNFMGNEIASFDEWDEKKSLPWFFLDFPKHQAVHQLFKSLNTLYRYEKALHIEEHNPLRFRWLMADNNFDNVYIFQRTYGDSSIISVFNMKGNYYNRYGIDVGEQGTYVEVLNSDHRDYGGWHNINNTPMTTELINGRHYIMMTIGSFAAIAIKKIS